MYVSTSLHEGLPVTLIEAMGFNLPVVSTDCVSGPREIIAPDEKLDEKFKYDLDFKYGILIAHFGNKKTFSSSRVNKEESFSLSNKLYNILSSKNLQSKFSKASDLRSEDFDKRNISRIWENELKKFF